MIGALIASQLPKPVDQELIIVPLPKPTFYVHFDKSTLHISSVSAKSEPADEHSAIAVPDELGEAFMVGTQSIANYEIIALRNDTHEVIKKDGLRKVLDRVDVVRVFYEITEERAYQSIEMTVIPEEDVIEIKYDGDAVKDGQTKFYFTRFNDPSFLKCALQLDVNTLNQIALINQTTEWPNPIRLKIDNVSDLSVFGIKGQTKASIHVKASS